MSMGQKIHFLLDHKEQCSHQVEKTVPYLQKVAFGLVQWQYGTLGCPSCEKSEFGLHVGKTVQGYLVTGEFDAGRDG